MSKKSFLLMWLTIPIILLILQSYLFASLYFDRYVRLLAPEIEVVSDERVAFMDSAALQSKDRTMT